MIKYQLQCDKDHDFAGWFASSDAFDKQVERKLVECPECGSTEVRKALMAPNVATSRKKAAVETAKATEARGEIVKAMREMRRKVEENAEYVGPRFAEEARRIHYKETEGAKDEKGADGKKSKGIYGEASLSEAKELAEEGIDFLPLPVLPEDQN